MAGLEESLKDYVERNSGVCCSQWDPAISQRLLFDPYDKFSKAFTATAFCLTRSSLRLNS